MKKILPLLLFVVCLTNANAQNSKVDTGYVGDVPVYLGKEFTESESLAIKEAKAKKNSKLLNERHRGFNLETLTGERINMASSLAKVSLFAFWDITCHYDLGALNELNEKYKYKDFQLVVIMFDTTGVRKLAEEQGLGLKFAKVRSVAEMQELNYGNGYPSFLILNTDNRILHIGSLHELNLGRYIVKGLLGY